MMVDNSRATVIDLEMNDTIMTTRMEIRQARGIMSLRQRAAKQKMLFFGHVMRANGLEKEEMLPCREGRELVRGRD